jgi:protein-tyrosine phosphatase
MEHASPSQAAVALGVPYAHFGLWDSALPHDNGGEEALVAILHRAADHLYRLLEAGQVPVLVHCQVGMSRSTTGLIAYLLKYKGAEFPTYAAAIAHVQQARPIASPNIRFARVLLDFFETGNTDTDL